MTLQFRVVQGRPRDTNVTFAGGDYLFGRGAECHVRPESEWVSRQHCLLRVTPGAAVLRDLGSSAGTLVNGERLIDARSLKEGDLVGVGPVVFEVRFDADNALV